MPEKRSCFAEPIGSEQSFGGGFSHLLRSPPCFHHRLKQKNGRPDLTLHQQGFAVCERNFCIGGIFGVSTFKPLCCIAPGSLCHLCDLQKCGCGSLVVAEFGT